MTLAKDALKASSGKELEVLVPEFKSIELIFGGFIINFRRSVRIRLFMINFWPI